MMKNMYFFAARTPRNPSVPMRVGRRYNEVPGSLGTQSRSRLTSDAAWLVWDPKDKRVIRPRDHKDPVKDPKDPKTVKLEGLTRDAVGAKYSATRREYEAYKQNNGMRLEPAWLDLVTFVQYQDANLDEAVRRIEAFRTKMRTPE